MDFTKKPIFAMIHLGGQNKLERATEEIDILVNCGIDGAIIENYHGDIDDVKDILHLLDKYQEKDKLPLKIGINILPNEYNLAYAYAIAYELDFIQMDHVSGKYSNGKQLHVKDYMKFRERFPEISVLGGVWPKYYTPVPDSNLENDIEKGIKRCDAIVVTGQGTGHETSISKIGLFKAHCGQHPLIVGAGLTPGNVVEQLTIADGAIVGSCFKPYGRTYEKIQKTLVEEFMSEVKKLRTTNESI